MPDPVFFPDGSLTSGKVRGFLSWLHTEQDYDALQLLDVIERPDDYKDEWDHYIVWLEEQG